MPIQTALTGYFLPYQTAWLNDPARLKIWEKSRRIGATYVQAFEDVMDCAKEVGCDVWFTSADQATSKEYIHYCADWARDTQCRGQRHGRGGIRRRQRGEGAGKRVCEWQAHPRTQQQPLCAARAWRQAGL